MSNSKEKYEETIALELEAFRDKYAGEKCVICATSVGGPEDYFDFTSVTRADIDYGIHGTQYIIAKAKNIKSEEEHPCYLKYVTKKAAIVKNAATPSHYDNGKGYDLIDVISDYKLNFNLGNAAKYVFRAGKKGDEITDLKKAIDYLQREINIIKNKKI